MILPDLKRRKAWIATSPGPVVCETCLSLRPCIFIHNEVMVCRECLQYASECLFRYEKANAPCSTKTG